MQQNFVILLFAYLPFHWKHIRLSVVFSLMFSFFVGVIYLDICQIVVVMHIFSVPITFFSSIVFTYWLEMISRSHTSVIVQTRGTGGWRLSTILSQRKLTDLKQGTCNIILNIMTFTFLSKKTNKQKTFQFSPQILCYLKTILIFMTDFVLLLSQILCYFKIILILITCCVSIEKCFTVHLLKLDT